MGGEGGNDVNHIQKCRNLDYPELYHFATTVLTLPHIFHKTEGW